MKLFGRHTTVKHQPSMKFIQTRDGKVLDTGITLAMAREHIDYAEKHGLDVEAGLALALEAALVSLGTEFAA